MSVVAAPVVVAERPPSTGAALRSGAGHLAMSQVVQNGARLLTGLGLARLLSPHDFGLLSIVAVLTVLLQRTVANSGLVTAIVQRAAISRELTSTIFWFQLVIGAATTAVLFVTAPWTSRLLGDATAADVLRGVSWCFLIAAFSKVPEAVMRREMQYGRVAALGSMNAVVTGVVAIPLAMTGHGVASMVVGQVAAALAETATAIVLSGWRPLPVFRTAELRAVTPFARRLTGFNVVNYLSDAGDKFVVGRWVGTTSLGLYSLPYRLLVMPVTAVAQVYRDLLFPVFARNQSDDDAIGRGYLRAVSAVSLVCIPLCAITAAMAQPMVDAVLGPRWHDAGGILAIMAVTTALQSVLGTSGMLLTSKGRSDILLRWGLGAGLVMMAFYAGGARWGATGVAWGYLAGTVVLAYPAMAIPFRQIHLPVRRLVPALWPAVQSSVVLTCFALAARVWAESRGASSMVVLLAGCVAGGSMFLLVLARRRPQALDDLLSIAHRRSAR